MVEAARTMQNEANFRRRRQARAVLPFVSHMAMRTASLFAVLVLIVGPAGCSSTPVNNPDSGCIGSCQIDNDCPELTCQCHGDAGSEMLAGHCTDGCCATCPPGCI